jgi:hypothetical protein
MVASTTAHISKTGAMVWLNNAGCKYRAVKTRKAENKREVLI